MDRRNRT